MSIEREANVSLKVNVTDNSNAPGVLRDMALEAAKVSEALNTTIGALESYASRVKSQFDALSQSMAKITQGDSQTPSKPGGGTAKIIDTSTGSSGSAYIPTSHLDTRPIEQGLEKVVGRLDSILLAIRSLSPALTPGGANAGTSSGGSAQRVVADIPWMKGGHGAAEANRAYAQKLKDEGLDRAAAMKRLMDERNIGKSMAYKYTQGMGWMYGGSIPHYAQGGYVHHTGPAYLHRGEYVVPASRVVYRGGGGGTDPYFENWPYYDYGPPPSLEQRAQFGEWYKKNPKKPWGMFVGQGMPMGFLLAEQERLISTRESVLRRKGLDPTRHTDPWFTPPADEQLKGESLAASILLHYNMSSRGIKPLEDPSPYQTYTFAGASAGALLGGPLGGLAGAIGAGGFGAGLGFGVGRLRSSGWSFRGLMDWIDRGPTAAEGIAGLDKLFDKFAGSRYSAIASVAAGAGSWGLLGGMTAGPLGGIAGAVLGSLSGIWGGVGIGLQGILNRRRFSEGGEVGHYAEGGLATLFQSLRRGYEAFSHGAAFLFNPTDRSSFFDRLGRGINHLMTSRGGAETLSARQIGLQNYNERMANIRGLLGRIGVSDVFSPDYNSLIFREEAHRNPLFAEGLHEELTHALQHAPHIDPHGTAHSVVLQKHKEASELLEATRRYHETAREIPEQTVMDDPELGHLKGRRGSPKFWALKAKQLREEGYNRKTVVEMIKELSGNAESTVQNYYRRSLDLAHGGHVGYLASGGVMGMHPGEPRGTDNIPAWLSPNEFVVNAEAARKHRGLLEQINSGHFAGGGSVQYLARGGISNAELRRRLRIAVRRMQHQRELEEHLDEIVQYGQSSVYGRTVAGDIPARGFMHQFRERLPQAIRFAGIAGVGHAALAAAPPGFTMALGALHGLQEAMENLAKVTNSLSNSSKSAASNMGDLVKGLPLIGSFVTAYIDLQKALNGTANQVRVATEAYLRSQAVLQTRMQYQGQVDTAQFEAFGAGRRALAMRAYRLAPSTIGPTARGTVAEQIAYEESRMVQPAREAVLRAEYEETAARGTASRARHVRREREAAVSRAEEVLRRAEEREHDATTRARGMRSVRDASGRVVGSIDAESSRISAAMRGEEGRRITDSSGRILRVEGESPAWAGGDISTGAVIRAARNPGGLFGAGVHFSDLHEGEVAATVNQRREAGNQLLAERARLQAAIVQEQKAEQDLATAGLRTGEARAQQLRSELEVARGREQRRLVGTERIGALHPMELRQNVHHLNMLLRNGIERSSRFTIETAASVAPALVARLRREHGERALPGLFEGVDPRFRREVEAEFGGRGPVGGLRAATDEAERALEATTRTTASEFATKTSEIMGKFAEDLAKIMTNAVDQVRRQVDADLRARGLLPGGG